MSDQKDDERRGLGGSTCPDCGSPRAADQRYCLSCGARLGALPGAVAEQLNLIKARAAGKPADTPTAAEKTGAGAVAGAAVAGAAVGAVAAGTEAEALESQGWPFARSSWMPSPRAASVAVVAMLALGVAIGSATSQLAQSAGLTTVLVEPEPKPPPPEEEPEEEVEAEPEEVEETPAETVVPEEAPVIEEEGGEEDPGGGEKEEEKEKYEEPAGLPEVKHVFLIVLGENGYEETFGATSTSTYFSKELPALGELLPNYYAVAGSDLANQIALISGQGPTPETAANCPNYGDVVPGTVSATASQVEGNGCVYPAEAKTLAGELAEKKLKWKAYVEDMAKGGAAGQPTSCRHPTLGTPDNSHEPVPGDAYETWRNPFVYFHSIIDGEECAKADVDLEQLATDLKVKEGKKFPALAYIVPNACHKGGETPCEPNAVAGPAAAEETLKRLIPEIEQSAAYVEGGLILITSSLARQTGATPDSSSCCGNPTYLNLPEPPPSEVGADGVKASGGGGKVGMLLISNFVEPGSVNETVRYNHFSLLATIDELFELEATGYAAESLAFEEGVFNAVTEEQEEFPPLGRRSRPLSRAISAARSVIPGLGR
ncbi:MAG TPA: alkaline phosphatase family protein [Solirubrobacterales bacterium]|nr:alkaline phosphatase family protein [Solirubrobacterales bacterium]